MKNNFSFIDLFSGIGGFHQAMSFFGGKCVLSSEIDPDAIRVYKENYGIDSAKNIRDIKIEDVPDHDVLCGGFPCQTFSKAGKREGFMDEIRGTLFFEIARILEAKHPKFILLENVKNLVSHDNGHTYQTICNTLNKLGYRIPEKPLILSPHQFGIPHFRERLFIPGVYDPANVDSPLLLSFDNLKTKSDNSIYSIIDKDEHDPRYNLSQHTIDVLNAWDEFHRGIDVKVIGFPVWSSYFKVSSIDPTLPEWKKEFIAKNRELYIRNKPFIDAWLKKWDNLKAFTPTECKFEWQCGDSAESIWDAVIQIRPSGVRVKKPDVFQALVALVQTPIIGKYKRRLSVREAARLQSFPDSFKPDPNFAKAYKQLGNSVNVTVLKEIFMKMMEAEQ